MGRLLGADGGGPTAKESRVSEITRSQKKGQTTRMMGRQLRGM